MVFHGKPRFGLRSPTPLPAYITLFPLIITSFIISPAWVHIPQLGPHRVRSPLPLAHTLGQAWNDPLEVDVAKTKNKQIYGNNQQENVPQNEKDSRDKHI